MTGVEIFMTVIGAVQIGANILFQLQFNKLNAYNIEKAKNEATKEDIVEITKKIENTKSEVTKRDIAEITGKIEEVKQAYNRLQHEYETRFSKLHDKRFEIIEALYEKARRLHIAAVDFTQTFKPIQKNFEAEEQARLEEYANAFNDLRKYWWNKDFYFDSTVNGLIDKLVNEYFENVYDFAEPTRMKKMGADHKNSPEYFKEAYKKASDASIYIREEVPKIFNSLKEEFQKIIGMEKELTERKV